MKRRVFITAAAAGLAAPRLGHGANAKTIRFVPLGDLAVLDPVWTTARPTRNHALLSYDTLYGLDNKLEPHPQMVAGHVVEDDGRTWTLTLREGLRFHDGTPVLARDAATSIRRFGARDGFGKALLAATDEITATGDRVLRFRLKRPFPLLPLVLSGCTSTIPVIMPERLAKTDPFQRVTEVLGSGPYRFLADERVSGAQVAYARFDGYVPRPDGPDEYTAGPKLAWFDRVEWTVIPDPATCAAALSKGEVDWWERPQSDFYDKLAGDAGIRLIEPEPPNTGYAQLNHLHPPFDNPAIRRIALSAIDQAEAMAAVAGTDPRRWQDKVGLFVREMAMANDAGIEVMARKRDYKEIRQRLQAAGYQGETVVALIASDVAELSLLGQIGADQLARAGFVVESQTMDFGTLVARRVRKDRPDKGGWSVMFSILDGNSTSNPFTNPAIESSGAQGHFGWPDSPEIEKQREQWLLATDLEAQRAICRSLQMLLWRDVPYIPMGAYYAPVAVRSDLQGVRRGLPQFYGVRRG